MTDLETLIYNDRSLWARYRLKTYRKSAFLISYQISNGPVDRLASWSKITIHSQSRESMYPAAKLVVSGGDAFERKPAT